MLPHNSKPQKKQISAITSKYAKDGKGDGRELESFKAMSKFLETQVRTLDDPREAEGGISDYAEPCSRL